MYPEISYTIWAVIAVASFVGVYFLRPGKDKNIDILVKDLTRIKESAEGIMEGDVKFDRLSTLLSLTSKYRDWFPVHTSYDPLKKDFVQDYAHRAMWFLECVRNYGEREGLDRIADAVRKLEDGQVDS